MPLPSPPARAAPRASHRSGSTTRPDGIGQAGGRIATPESAAQLGRPCGRWRPMRMSIVGAVVALRRHAARPGAGLIAGYSGHLWKMLLITGSLCCLDDTTDPRGTKPSVVRYARRQHISPAERFGNRSLVRFGRGDGG